MEQEKFKNLRGVLGKDTLETKTNFMSSKVNFVFSEEDVQKIEAALAGKDTSAIKVELETLKTENATQKEFQSNVESAVNTAMELNELEAQETTAKSVELLGTTCKAYGDKNNTHTMVQNNGEEITLDGSDGVFNANDEHNNID